MFPTGVNSLTAIAIRSEISTAAPGPPTHSRPNVFALYQNYPNPFNPETGIRYSVPRSAGRDGQVLGVSWVRLVVYDILGRQVAVLVDGRQTPGEHEVRFDGGNLSSGVYFYRLTAGSSSKVRTMVLLK